MSLSMQIKEFALDLGYSKVGFTTAEDFSEFEAIITSRSRHYDWYINSPAQPLKYTKIKENFPKAKTIIVLVWDYGKVCFPENLLNKVGRIYQSRCYNPPAERINGARFKLMKDFLSDLGLEVYWWKYMPERWAAARAGVINFGKNTLAYADGIGSFINISILLIDKELEYDEPTMENKCPDNCTKCIDACPTGALYEPFKINPYKCIAFHTFGLSPNGVIPEEIRPKLNTKIHGCDICQEVCPRNRDRLKQVMQPDVFLEEIAKNFSLVDMLHMPEGFYESRLKPIMYNYISNLHIFQRNAAVAIGNTRDASYIPDLEIEISHPDEMVRTHVAWALGRIGGNKAIHILEHHMAIEKTDKVKNEIQNALKRIACAGEET